MKEIAVGIRVNGSQYLTYTRIIGRSVVQENSFTVSVDGVRIVFGELIENIEVRDLDQ